MNLIHVPIVSFLVCMGLIVALTVGKHMVVAKKNNDMEDHVNTEDSWEDKCGDALFNYFGTNHNKTIGVMAGVATLILPNWSEKNPILDPKNTGYSDCGVTQMMLSLIISRNLQQSSESVIPNLHAILAAQARSFERFRIGGNQTPEEQKEVIDSLKLHYLHRNKPVMSACTIVNTQDESKDLGHTFVIHKTKPDSVRIYQSFAGQYDLYAWFTQNPEDRIRQSVTAPSELSGVLSNVTMTNFIDRLEYLISGKASLNEILEYAKIGFWGTSQLDPPHSTFINIVCDNVNNYTIEDDCQIGINNIEKKLREIGFIR